MEANLEWSRRQRVARITLHASEDGRTLYESLGFTISNEMRIQFDQA
jgi:hypothetical protein